MKNLSFSRLFAVLICAILALPELWAQQPTQPWDPGCFSAVAQDTVVRSAFINYGNGVRMKSASRRTKLTIGQLVVGPVVGDDNNMNFGYWAGFLVAPFPPFVTATQGELLDRIQISWGPNPLGPFAVGGFKIYRDGVYLAQVDKSTRNYNDFNVIAGRPYNYEVRGINAYGEGSPGKALGFQVPNGVVTGWVRTLNDSPVPNALVTLMPMQGYSAYFGANDGAYAEADTSTNGDFLPTTDSDWSVTFWIKTIEAINNPIMFRLLTPNGGAAALSAKALSSGGMEMDIAGTTLTGSFDPTANNWHHVTLSYSSGGYRMYLDGVLKDLKNGPTILNSLAIQVGKRASNGHWVGHLDELRIYYKKLDELDIPEIMEGTASSLTEGLKYYWKMDEQQGSKSFDIRQRTRFFFCGAIFANDRPPVRTAGKTNEEGYYRIESANYGTGITFLAKPEKLFYKHRALKFVRSEQDYATLPDFSLTPKATIETWVNSAGPGGTQTILSKRWAPNNSFQLQLEPNGTDNNIIFKLNNQAHNFGLLGIGYHHLAFTLDSTGTNTIVTGYKDGVLLGSVQMPAYTNTWSDPSEPWVVGARKSGSDFLDFYDGLVDEVAVYDSTLAAAKILEHAQSSRNPQERGLRIYFAMDEGTGTRLNNAGSVLLSGVGTGVGTTWTIMAPNQSTTPHVFTPATRQVTLNPSITSVDQVDFVDRSTVAVSGFVRYKNTDCFAKNVEILVNGASYSPKILTDSTGKFVIDFEPGASAVLTPVFEDHQFIPASWEVVNVISPVAGILFNDVTTRTINGFVAGGDCKRPILSNPNLPSGTVCIVKVRSIDDCFERIIQLGKDDGDDSGEYEFLNLPPIEMTVAVVEHSDPNIKTAFQVEGGKQVNLTKKDTILDFIYYAPPEVELVSGLDPVSLDCPTIVLEKNQPVTITVKLVERYVGGDCSLDTASFRIINGLSDEALDTVMSGGTLKYTFKVGEPNPSPPYLKTIQIIGTSLAGQSGDLTKQAVVTGIRNKENTFTTMLPETPSVILRDPPGDGSSAFLEKNTKFCKNYTASFDYEVGGGGGLELHLGGNVNVIIGTPLSGTIVNSGPIFDINAEFQVTYQKTSDSSFQTCMAVNEKLATSDSDLIVGGENGADIYMGEAINLIFGFADLVTFNDTMCAGDVKQVLNVEPGEFSTVFAYSEFHIVNNVMRYLKALAEDPNADSTDIAQYQESYDRWEAIIERNKGLKEKAKFERNLSFDAGVTYEYSISSDTTSSNSTTNATNSEQSLATHFGFEFNKFGIVGMAKFVSSTSDANGSGTETESGITTGYTLADDDPGDAFTVDVAMDSVYKTPVFRLKAGQSSCPWEPGTANREAPNLALAQGSQFTAINVPANEPAVFQLNLGNLSATNEDWTYGLVAVAASNPHGAVIKLNGAPLNYLQKYIIQYGTSIPVTLTVERGPVEYEYDSLLVALVSECEYEQNLALSLLLDSDTKFFSPLYLSAHFIRPCSEVDINVPQQDWVIFPDPITQGPDDIMRITVSKYNKSDADFEKIRVQYRPSDGDGAWINIVPPDDPLITAIQPAAEIDKANLGPVFTQFYWNTLGLADGPYEIRAIAICSGDAADKPGYSQIIKGRIERQPPSLIGVPQPSDGVYHVGDEISFTFNKHVNCAKINALDNVLLFDATTGLPIDIDITCFENKIMLDPNFQNEFFENRILRAEVREIEDKTGNKLLFEKWEFYVDRNELAWLTDSVGMTKFEDQTKTITANIHNRGGYPVPFEILNLPEWVHVVPKQGTLASNEIRPVTFRVDSTLAIGHWKDSITLRTITGQNPFFMGGDEGLPLGVRVICRPPNWNLNANLFENTENMVLELNIQGEISTDVEDIVVAFIGDTLCGKANIQYVPQVGKYLAYLTIYGNPYHVLQPLRLEIWDASACLRYAVLEDQFLFQPDDIIGDPTAPQVINATTYVLRDVPLGFGWNWLSFNLEFPDPEINAVLASLKYPANDLMKGQNLFSVHYNGGGWLGSLNTLGNTPMYIYRADQPDTLQMLGNVLNPATTPISVVNGWNWIGYIPNYSLPVNEALSSLPAQSGDLIKSQVSFAQYIAPYGWIGNLKFMQPPNGYQIKVSAPGTLIYPPKPSNLQGGGAENSANNRGPNDDLPPTANFWTVNPAAFEHSMTLIGMLKANEINATSATMELGAFAGEQSRGSVQAIYIEPLQSYLFFLTVYANASGEQIRYKLFDSSTGNVQDLSEQMFFSPDLHQGSIDTPVPFTLPTSSLQTQVSEQSFEVQPNPFHNETVFRFLLVKAQEVQVMVTDMSGKQVSYLTIDARQGLNTVIWRGQSDNGTRLANGVYFVRFQTESGNVVRKVVLH